MSILVERLFNNTFSIIRSSQSGDFNVDDWNLACASAEDQLYSILRSKGLMDSDTQMNAMPFRGVYSPPQTANGVYAYPADYFEYIAASCTIGLNQMQIPVGVIADAKWSPLVSSKLIPVANNPILRLENGTMQLQPVTANLNLVYYKTITHAFYGATYNADDEPIYDAGTSVNSMFMESLFTTLVDMIIVEAAKSLRDSQLLSDTVQTTNA